MIKLFLLLSLLPVLMLFPTGRVYAHVLSTDGSIGAILHINPDDSAQSGLPTSYDLWFTDTGGTMRLADCDCNVTVKNNDKTVGSKPLEATSDLDSSNTFTFPEPAVYALEVTGKPKNGASFQPFALSYSLRVTSGDVQTQSVPAILWVGIASAIGLIILAARAMELGGDGARRYHDNGKV